jgi:hypothetical protein
MLNLFARLVTINARIVLVPGLLVVFPVWINMQIAIIVRSVNNTTIMTQCADPATLPASVAQHKEQNLA